MALDRPHEQGGGELEPQKSYRTMMQQEIAQADEELQRPARGLLLSGIIAGLTRSLLNNMVIGTSTGFQKVLEINGVGYRAQKTGRNLTMSLGFSHPVIVEAPEGIELNVGERNTVIVAGVDKQLVGEVAANIRSLRPPEPYKGKGIKYADEVIRRKAGKAGKTGGKGGKK